MLGLATVLASAPDVEKDDHNDEGKDIELKLEVIDGGALPHAIPLGVGNLADGRRRRRCGGGAGGDRGQGSRSRIGCARIIGEVCEVALAMRCCSCA